MCKTILLIILSSTLIQAQSNEINLTVEPNHSTIGFSIGIAGGITRVTGKFMEFDLKLKYINEDLTQSSVLFTIMTKSITTGIPDRDDHLRSADFFNVESFPEITFQSSSIKKTNNGFEAIGVLFMHGVEKTVSIPFELLHKENTQLGIQIRWHLNRLDFGIGKDFKHTAIENFLAEDIDIEINFWTKRDKRE